MPSIIDTQLAALTGSEGFYSVTGDFLAQNNVETTYTVTASFTGTNPLSAVATASPAGGTTYTF